MTSDLFTTRAGKTFAALAVALVVATAAGLVALWPDNRGPTLAEFLLEDRAEATIERVAPAPCSLPQGTSCRQVAVTLTDGPAAGTFQTLRVGEDGNDPGELASGDEVVVTQARDPRSGQLSGQYQLADQSRSGTIGWLALLFGIAVVALGRRRGLLSLVGLGVSLAIVVQFIVPAILDGKPALLVALIGSLAVMLVTIALAHGVGPKSLAAALGTAASLLLTVFLAVVFTELGSLTGFASEEAQALRLADPELSLRGLVLAGIVIAALGVLDDVTVSQASTVMALRRANPAQGARELFSGALAVGRDHVSATVNTLVLAYVGASLPLLLYFSVGEIGAGDALDREAVAQQVIGTLVGSLGLVAAVPLTTLIAAALAVRMEPATIGEVPGHAH